MKTFQLHCCGVEGVSDFEVGKAQEFHKYAKVYADKNGVSKQAIPEACCKLKPRNQTSREQGLFIPVDEDCITVPTTYNSNMNKVNIQYSTSQQKPFEYRNETLALFKVMKRDIDNCQLKRQ